MSGVIPRVESFNPNRGWPEWAAAYNAVPTVMFVLQRLGQLQEVVLSTLEATAGADGEVA